jgi:putative ABC transport system substrate-binding protein
MQFRHVKRREFIALIAGAAIPPLAGRAQAMPVIAFLSTVSAEAAADNLLAFKQGLGQAGFIEGRNLAIEYRWAGGDYNRLAALASDLASRDIKAIAATGGSISALAPKAATATIPIVFAFGDADPLQNGLVASFRRPGGNITGVTMVASALGPKRLELLHDLVPKAKLFHVLVNPNNAGTAESITDVAAAAQNLGVAFAVVPAGSASEIDAAFASMAGREAQVLVVWNDSFLMSRAAQIIGLAAQNALPAMYPWREYVTAGGLMSYGTNIHESYRQLGLYVAQILKGTQPADLPVQEPTKFELVINLKTARALGIELPMSLLMRLDEVIE